MKKEAVSVVIPLWHGFRHIQKKLIFIVCPWA